MFCSFDFLKCRPSNFYLIYDIFNIQLDRTPLHYAYLFMPQKDVIEKLVKAGAMKDRHDPVCVNSDVK